MDLDGVCLKTQRGEEKVVFEGRTYRKKNPNEPPYFSSSKHTLTTYYVCCLNPKICLKMEQRNKLYRPMNLVLLCRILCSRAMSRVMTCVLVESRSRTIGREQARVLVESRVLKGELSLSSAVGQVVRQLSVQHGRDEACLFPSSFSMKRTMNRKLEIVFGPSPWSMANLTKIPGNFSYTKSDEPFLLVFRNYYKPDGSFVGPILVFATNEDLRQLFQPSGGAWLVDGTFKTKPYPYARIRAFWRSPYSLEISNIASRVTGNARG